MQHQMRRQAQRTRGASYREQVMERIQRRNGHVRPIVIVREFVTIAGSMRAAALLSQLLYWTDRASSPEGWVYKTRVEWCAELGLTLRELDTARRRLRAGGFIEESCRLVGTGRTLHIRLCIEKLSAALDALSGSPSDSSDRPACDASKPGAVQAASSSDLETSPGPRAAEVLESLSGLTGVELEHALTGRMREFIPWLGSEPKPGGPAWVHAAGLLPEDVRRRLPVR